MTKYFLFSFIFLFSVNFVSANDISQFVFTSNPQTIKPNEVSGKLTVQAQDANGNGIPQTGCIAIETTSNTGEFSASSTNWILINRLTMSKGGKTRNFYYKDSSLGSYKIKAKIALRPDTIKTACTDWPIEQWNIQLIAEQDIIVSNTAESTPPESTSTEPEPTSDVGSENWPVEPQIFANAGKDKTVIVGADVYFSGQALGIEKEPLENARYLWNFGDGAIAENQNVKHVYQYPGEYIAVLDVASGKYSTSDNLLVKVIPNQLKISEANEGFVKLQNGSNNNLDISGWVFRAGNEIFKFPASTFIKANSALMISFSVSGIKIDANEKIELLYSNWSVADSFTNVKHPISNPEPTTVVGKNDSTSSTSSTQVASVITVEKNDFWTPKKWLGLVVLLAVFSIIGFLFIRHKFYEQK